jgi:thymidylate synthase
MMYEKLLKQVLEYGEKKSSRGVLVNKENPSTISLFGTQTRYSLSGYKLPIVTTKKVNFKGVLIELLWFLRGDTNIKFLKEHSINIWDNWADEKGDLGPVYGAQWRNFEGVDQIKNLERSLIHDPSSRRHIVCAWNAARIQEMHLPPCHVLFQFYVDDNRRLSCHLFQRSADLFLGVPWNVACYSLLTMMLARCHNFEPHEFIHSIGDAHIYENHIDQVKEQLTRLPYDSPQLWLPQKDSILQYQPHDFQLINYNHHPPIKGEVAI